MQDKLNLFTSSLKNEKFEKEGEPETLFKVGMT